MSRRALLVLFSIVLAGCRRDVPRLDDVGKMAYGVKPGVVRISAYANAEVRYPAAAIRAIGEELRREGRTVTLRDPGADDAVIETGAGGSGTGFIIHPDGYIVTSAHVVAPTRNAQQLDRDLRRNGAVMALLRHFPKDKLYELYRGDELDRFIAPLAQASRVEKVRLFNQVELSNGETMPFVIRRYSPPLSEGGSDLAIVKVERNNLPSVPLGDSDTTRVGDSVWSVGYPAVASTSDELIGGWLSRESDLEATVNPGTITAIKVNAAKTPVFQSNVAIYRGNSGGPAVDKGGQVIAVSTWGHSSAEQIKFLVPINVVRQVVAEANIPVSAGGEFNQHYRAALDAAREGKWVDAKMELVRATQLFPNSPDLIRFGRDAERALRDLPMWRRHPVATGIATGFVAFAFIGTTFLFVRSRKPRFPPDLMKAATVETLVSPNGSGGNQAMLGKFTILNGMRAGEKLGLGGSGIRIGRESAICEIVLENPKVSRLHAEVVSIDGKVLLIDRNSSNGTYVNDQKIDKRFLKDGDIIYFGGRNAVAVAFHA